MCTSIQSRPTVLSQLEKLVLAGITIFGDNDFCTEVCFYLISNTLPLGWEQKRNCPTSPLPPNKQNANEVLSVVCSLERIFYYDAGLLILRAVCNVRYDRFAITSISLNLGLHYQQ